MDDHEQTIRTLELQIERFFQSSRIDREKLHGANEMLKELAHYNRVVAESRGIGVDTHLSDKPDNLTRFERIIKRSFFME